MEISEIMEELSLIPGPSGYEDAVAERIAGYLEPLSDDVRIDAMGNVIAHRASVRQDAEKLLLDAHIDEVGFIVTEIVEGFLRFSALGNTDARNLPGREVTLMTDPPMYGVIACLPPHVLSAAEREKAVALKDLFIDIGLSDSEARDKVKPGTPGVFRGEFTRMREDFVSGKAMDNRVCAAVLIDVLQKLQTTPLDVELYVMFSTQEELGLRGAQPGAFSVQADYCVVADVTYGRSMTTPKQGTYKLGCGVTVGAGPNMNRKFSQKLFDTCEKYNIPCETEVMAGNTGTNAWPIQVSRTGVATAVLSVPLRYMHSSVELLKLSDASAASGVLVNLIKDWGQNNA